ncbi:MAG: Transcriptional regulator, LacI family [Actinomycetia bacterium]|nr:Transcriptional regulator, LacI family [Actinomycetes bacterium]MDQ1655564.1 Bacterial regulatory protein lacI family [Cryptosporangiaceae bacterium]
MYVSLKDVAARSRASFQIASKVLSGQAGVVSTETPERIRAAASDLGYAPNALARTSSLTIGVLTDDMAAGALTALPEHGLGVPADGSVASCDDLPFAAYLPAELVVHGSAVSPPNP